MFVMGLLMVVLGGGGFTIAGVGLYKADRDQREQQADPICYRVARHAGAPPWTPLAERDGKPVTFDSSEEAAQFAHKYQLKVCP